jgi:hypothetical protein
VHPTAVAAVVVRLPVEDRRHVRAVDQQAESLIEGDRPDVEVGRPTTASHPSTLITLLCSSVHWYSHSSTPA